MIRLVRYRITTGAYCLAFYDSTGKRHELTIDIDGEATVTAQIDTLETTDIKEIHDAAQNQTDGGLDESGSRY